MYKLTRPEKSCSLFALPLNTCKKYNADFVEQFLFSLQLTKRQKKNTKSNLKRKCKVLKVKEKVRRAQFI